MVHVMNTNLNSCGHFLKKSVENYNVRVGWQNLQTMYQIITEHIISDSTFQRKAFTEVVLV